MASSFAFNLVRLNSAVATACMLGIRNPDYQRRDVRAPRADDGTLHQTTTAVRRTAPMARFGTVAVRTLAGVLSGSSELPMVALDGSNGLEMIGGKINSAGPGYLATSTHARRVAITGQLYLAGLNWRINDVLEAACEAFFYAAAGGTDPVTAGVVALPTPALNTEQLVLTALTIGGTAFGDGCVSAGFSIAHQCENNDEEICYNAGLPHPVALKQAGVGGASEIVGSFETVDLSTAVPASGTVVATFTLLAPLGVGIGSTGITVTLNTCLLREEEIPGQNGQAAKRKISAYPTFNGTNRPITVVQF